MNINIEINLTENLWKAENSRIKSNIKSIIKKIIPATQLALIAENIELEISLLLTNDQEIQRLNKLYLKKDKPTNVLSFPANDVKKIKNGKLDEILKIEDFLALGDIVLSYQTIKKEAFEQNKEFNNHLTHLLIHSVLHLIGYDHIDDIDAELMEGLEIKLLKKLDIENPYII
jgi:probable rRNA maturation factor